MPEFIHLHNHSHFSLLDGAATIDGLVDATVKNKMPAVALTDHGVMFGAIEFYETARKAGVKPIIGCEAYIVTKGSRFDKEVNAQSMKEGRGRGIYHHLVLLAKNFTGYRNLVKLVSLGHTEGFYYKPRIDMELLRKYAEGVIALSACPSGVVSYHLVNGNYNEARDVAATFRDLFKDDFYLEIQNHNFEKEAPILANMPKLARELNVKLIATNDVHYIEPDHAIAHNVMLLIPDASASTTTDYRQLRYQTDQIYFKSAAQMCDLFRDFPEAIASTLEVAEKVEQFKIEPEKPYMPNFPIPPNAGVSTLEDYLERLAREGLSKRYPTITPEIEERLNFELSVIKNMGYAGYFLLTQDFINAAREMGAMVGPGRGSAAGSIVSYALGITDVDQLKYALLFARFLNPDRVSMPDIDLDFSDDKRDAVIEYVKKKWGEDSVSQIITFGTLSSRAVLKDVGRVLGIPLSTTESITKQIPVFQGRVMPLREAIDQIPELKWVKESKDEKIQELIRVSLVLEGMNRNSSTHAAGVVIAPGPLMEYVPLYKTPQTDLMTQYNMLDLEVAGLLKMDFLGLRTLTIIKNALELIEERHGIDVDLDTIPEDDAKTFELFGKGQTAGVFQFESSGMQDWLRKLKPSSISDLVAMNALYRPGPMEMIGDYINRKHGRQKIEYIHPKLETTLKETYGIIVYQEQVIKITSEVAGFSLAKADLLRRAMGKKDRELMAKQKTEFIDGATAKGFTKKVAGDIFDMIEKFASYGFNKSHSVAYSVLAYQTAFLKAHYPAEYMAAAISAEIGDTDYVVQLIDECRKMRIAVLPPDVNESDAGFTVAKEGIRFGLTAIKNVGVSAVENIIKARTEKGPFENIFDFCCRVDLRAVNKKTIESLIQAGACDALTKHRAQIFEVVEKAIQYGQNARSHLSKGQSSLFEIESSTQKAAFQFPPLSSTPAWNEAEQLSREKAVLGFYVSGHPLRKYELEITAFTTAQFGNPSDVKSGSIVRVGGILTSVKKKIDKKGNMMAFITMEDFTGKGEGIVFSDAYKQFGEQLKEEAMILAIGKAEQNSDSLRVIVNEIYPMEIVRERLTKSIVLNIRVDDVPESAITELRQVAERHKGKYPCRFNVILSKNEKPVRLQSTKYAVGATDEFFAEVEKILGPDSVRISS
ncbi:MAG: DNA polymerase III subunit alpha [Ignavibacteriae bacterium]|nr:DNA polymerase III subunit alpha [Ignavibacteriota bacterium]